MLPKYIKLGTKGMINITWERLPRRQWSKIGLGVVKK